MHRARVLQHHYNALTQKWTKQQSEIQIEDKPFAEGAFRAAYSCTMQWENSPSASFVCKFAKDSSTPRTTYFNDVEAHEIATLYARKFNEHLPECYPRITYVPAFILEFVDRPGRPVCGCEMLLQGKFKKYNNNVGAVCAMTHEEQAELSRSSTLTNWDPTSTAQAFSHFSYDHSGSQILICDIQGVENRFTDPQIHTISGKGFGLGNLGSTGIRAFLLRHTCNEHCRAVGLQPIKAKDLNEKNVTAAATATTQSQTASAAATALLPGGGVSSNSNNGIASYQQSKRHAHNGTGSGNYSNSNGSNSDVLVLNNDTPTSAASSSASNGNSSTSSMPPPPHRGMHSSASTAVLSTAASQALLERSRMQQQQQRSPAPPSHSSSHSTPAQSTTPDDSPRASFTIKPGGTNQLQQQQHQPTTATPIFQPTAAQRTSTPSSTKLDDSDEALMAAIMGD